jgi:hypothetical protein
VNPTGLRFHAYARGNKIFDGREEREKEREKEKKKKEKKGESYISSSISLLCATHISPMNLCCT